jgi:hypothetical protein
MTNVFKKLQGVRHAFASANVKKSGKNKFAGYEYFELGDFIPVINAMFDEVGLIGVVRFTKDEGSLTVYNVENPEEKIVFTTPMVFASNPKGQPIQDLGSTHTYMRRYLWLMTMEIVEHDSVDASAPSVKPQKSAEVPAIIPQKNADNDLFVEKMIEHGLVLETKSELADLWKSNQKQIDQLKGTEAFDKLKNAFAEMKTNLED